MSFSLPAKIRALAKREKANKNNKFQETIDFLKVEHKDLYKPFFGDH